MLADKLNNPHTLRYVRVKLGMPKSLEYFTIQLLFLIIVPIN